LDRDRKGEVVNRDPVANNVLVEALGSSLSNTNQGQRNAPALLRQVLKEESWRFFKTRLGADVTPPTFAEFVKSAPLQGLGMTIEDVRQAIAKDTVALDMFDRACKESENSHGGDRKSEAAAIKSNNITLDPPDRGTSEEYALRKLRKSAPALHAQVLAGKCSAHAAMVKAGFRPKAISVNVTRADSMAKALRKHVEPSVLAELVALLLTDR
jgi:hypothetical protein